MEKTFKKILSIEWVRMKYELVVKDSSSINQSIKEMIYRGFRPSSFSDLLWQSQSLYQILPQPIIHSYTSDKSSGGSHCRMKRKDVWTGAFVLFFFFLAVLGFEFRASWLLSKHSATWATPPARTGALVRLLYVESKMN
jgi:hypothetical protein